VAKRSARQIAKDKAWDQFSIYIRTRDCLRFSGNPFDGKCVTCWRDYPFKKLQAGHFIQGRGNAVLFDERLVYTQCVGCNGNPPFGKGGNYVEYFLFMEREWGREKIDEFVALKHQTKIYKIHDFIELREQFKQKTLDLLKAHGY
jgi:hypothetical protein